MATNDIQTPYPLRAKAVRHILQAFAGSRGHASLYRLLRYSLRIPKQMVIDLDDRSPLRIHCDLDEYMQWWLFSYGLKSEPDFEVMRSVLRPNDHFVDVGANIGVFSMLASLKVGDEGIVYAIEALPFNQVLLEKNIALNHIRNVRLVPVALTDQDGELDLFPSTNGNLGMTSLSSVGEKGKPVRVRARTLDSLMAEGTIAGCDVLKIDIEGAEPLALQGMQTLFATRPPRAVLIEVSESLLANFGAKPSDILNFFTQHGYNWHRATAQGLEPLNDLNVRGHNNLWALLAT